MLEGYKLAVYRKIKFGPVARKYRERAKERGLISERNEWLGTIREKALFLSLLYWKLNVSSHGCEKIPWAELLCLFDYTTNSHKDLLKDSRDVAKEWRNLEALGTEYINERFSNIYAIFC